MKILTTVRDFMSFVGDRDTKWITLMTSCSNQELYSNWYMNCPNEFEERDVTFIELEKDNIVLYVL